MSTLLVRDAEVLATFDDDGTEIAGGGLFARDGWIERVGPTEDLPATADDVIDAGGCVVLPGFVNTHHHLYQTLTRAVPGALSVGLFPWLRRLYPIWMRMTPAHVEVATTVGLAELALSGCTTVFDHHYVWPNGSRLDDQVAGAAPIGVRVHLSRGSMSIGESDGGLPPDAAVEDEAAILDDCRRVVERFHDPAPGSHLRIVLAPCSPFSVSTNLMRDSAELARSLGVRLHTHLAETDDEEQYCLERYGLRPVEYAEQVEWVGQDVWFAHAVHVADEEAARLADTHTGVAHCPTSNLRLASGLAPLVRYRELGVRVGLGVDGSASNDSSGMLAEARQALLVARLSVAPGMPWAGRPQLEPREALRLATLGGADLLGRDDVGALEAGKACDLAIFDVADLEHAGSWDPVAAVVLCAPRRARHTVVHGRRVVRDGRLTGVEEAELAARHRGLARRLVEG